MSSLNPYSELLSEDLSSEPNQPSKRQRLVTPDPFEQACPADAEAKEASDHELVPQLPTQSESDSKFLSDVSVSLISAVERLKIHLKNPKKTEKALILLRRLMEEKLNPSNVDTFFSVFVNFSPSLVDPTRSEFGVLCEIIALMRTIITNHFPAFASRKYCVDSWFLETIVRRDISTDDTIQFSKCCRVVQTFAENLLKDITDARKRDGDISLDENKLLDSAAVEYRKQSIISCMKEAYRFYKRQWARQPVDSLLRAVADRRHLFDGKQLEELDSLLNMHARERNGASVNLAPVAIRAYDSTYHPIRSKNCSVLK
jgi:hypothetical protein